MGASQGEAGSCFGKHRHMLNSPALLITLLYRALAQSGELRYLSDREIKKRPS